MNEVLEDKKRGKVYFVDNNMLYLPAIADKCGYEVKINKSANLKQTINDIEEYTPDFIVALICFKDYKYQMEALAGIKESYPLAKIIVTGEPFLTYNHNVTYENPFISYVIVGEAEYAFRDILEGVPDKEILGICYTDENMQAIKNDARPFIENLDELPFPIRDFEQKDSVSIEISRGCPYHCFFCMATPLRGKQIRYRSVNNIIEEIKYCIKEYNIKNFVFKADNFNENKKWCIELCKKIIENKLKIQWSVNILPKNIDNELAVLMKKSGCKLCNIGIESGAISILNSITKNITIEDIINTNNLLKKNNIARNNCFILGLPEETEDTARETIKLALELDSENVSFNIAAPFPGTKFFVYALINKLVTEDLNFDNAIVSSIIRTHKLSKKRIEQIRRNAIKRFYIRPKYILHSILSLNFNTLLKLAKIYFNLSDTQS